MLQLVSESMEARMQGREALLRLQSTVKAISQLCAGNWPRHHAGDFPTAKNLEVSSSVQSVSVSSNDVESAHIALNSN